MPSPTLPKDVAVLVLNWDGLELLRSFLPSWVKFTPEEADLIIIDNGSTDGSVAFVREHYPEVRLVAFTENYGFAAGYNKAIAELDYKTVVLLNSDVELSDGWLREPLELLSSDPSITAVQPTIRAQRSPQDFEYAGAAGGYIDSLGYPFCRGRIAGSRPILDTRRSLLGFGCLPDHPPGSLPRGRRARPRLLRPSRGDRPLLASPGSWRAHRLRSELYSLPCRWGKSLGREPTEGLPELP